MPGNFIFPDRMDPESIPSPSASPFTTLPSPDFTGLFLNYFHINFRFQDILYIFVNDTESDALPMIVRVLNFPGIIPGIHLPLTFTASGDPPT